jgi:hypothetical protein
MRATVLDDSCANVHRLELGARHSRRMFSMGALDLLLGSLQLSAAYTDHKDMHALVLKESQLVLKELNALQENSTVLASQLDDERAASETLRLKLQESRQSHCEQIEKLELDITLLKVCPWGLTCLTKLCFNPLFILARYCISSTETQWFLVLGGRFHILNWNSNLRFAFTSGRRAYRCAGLSMQRAKDTASLQEAALQAEMVVLKSSLAAALEQKEHFEATARESKQQFVDCTAQVKTPPNI